MQSTEQLQQLRFFEDISFVDVHEKKVTPSFIPPVSLAMNEAAVVIDCMWVFYCIVCVYHVVDVSCPNDFVDFMIILNSKYFI